MLAGTIGSTRSTPSSIEASLAGLIVKENGVIVGSALSIPFTTVTEDGGAVGVGPYRITIKEAGSVVGVAN